MSPITIQPAVPVPAQPQTLTVPAATVVFWLNVILIVSPLAIVPLPLVSEIAVATSPSWTAGIAVAAVQDDADVLRSS